MPAFKFSAAVTCSAAFFLSCLPAVPVTAAAPQYTLQDLGTLTPNGSAKPQGINQAGEIFGSASPISAFVVPDHVFFWSPQGGMVDIGTLPYINPPSYDQSQAPMSAVAMNDHGQIIGVSEIEASAPSLSFFGPVNHAFLWTPTADYKSGAIQDLGTLGANINADIGSTAVAINNRGQVIGTADALTLTAQGYRNIDPAHGFLWTPGGTDGVASNPQMKDLGLLQPSLLDNKGNVIGLLNGVVTVYNGHNFLSLGDPAGFDLNAPYGTYRMQLLRTDARGDIYGNFSTPNFNADPFVWVADYLGATTGHFIEGIPADTSALPPGTPTAAQLPADAQLFESGRNVFSFDPQNASISYVNLGGLIFDTIDEIYSDFPPFETYTFAQNQAGDLVGYSELPTGNPSAFLEHGGLMYSLNLHLQDPSIYHLWDGVGINNAGQIAALGQLAGIPYANLRAFVLTPAGQAPAAAPTIQLIQPQPPDAGDPDQRVDVQGTEFQLGAVVTYDGKPLAATVYAETQILAYIPSAKLTAGTHTIKVTNPDGRVGSGSYVVLPVRPVPSLVSVRPVSLPAGSPDTAITLSGTGLYPETQVGYGYGPQNDTLLTVLSASADHTQITVRLPASAMTQGTTLTFYAATPGQRGDAANVPAPVLTVINPVPIITSISPASVIADTASGFTLTVNGSHFVPGTRVIWDGAYTVTQYISPTQVTAIIYDSFLNGIGPDLIPPGPVPIQVINAAPGGGSASTMQTFTDGPYPAPTLTSVDPSVAAPNTSGYLFLNGSHFLHHSVVHIGSQTFSVAVSGNGISADRTQITLYLPASAFPAVGVYPVTVVNSSAGGGGGTSAIQYVTVQGPSLRVSGAILSRDPATQEIIAQVTLTAGPGADVQGVTLSQASLGTASATGLPPAVGTIAAGTTTAVTLRFPASAVTFGIPAVLRVSGRYSGGSFVSSRRVVL